MDRVAKRIPMNRVLLLAITLLVGAVVSLAATSPAYAAEGAATHDDGASGALVAQDLTGTTYAISRVPENNPSMYEVYPTYMFFNGGFMPAPDGCNLYMEYRQGKGAWQTTGYMSYLTTYQISGLKPNKKYQARLYYGSRYSSARSAYSPIVTFKTAKNKKPPVKSARVRAINVKQHWQKIYGYVIYLGKRKFFTYKLQTTVTFKKAPQGKYLVINGKVFKIKKGKRTYTVTTSKLYRYYTRPHGRYTVTVYTYQNKAWKGYSKLYKKSCKYR